MKITKTEELRTHPMEEILNIESGTTMMEHHTIEVDPIQSSSVVDYDEKDDDIEQRLVDIYDLALNQAAIINDEIEMVEGKYKASLAENSAAMLNIALGSVRERSLLKQHKDKLQIATDKINLKKGDKHVTNNNLIVANRNEIMKMLKDNPDL